MVKKLGKVIINIGYVVDLNNQTMVDEAVDCIVEDIHNAVKYNELFDWVEVVEAPDADESDIPDFLLDQEEDSEIDDD